MTQGVHVLEESGAAGQGGAHQAVAVVGETEDGMEEEGQDVHVRQQRGEMLFAVAEVVFEVIVSAVSAANESWSGLASVDTAAV